MPVRLVPTGEVSSWFAQQSQQAAFVPRMAQPLPAETLDLRDLSAIHDAALASEYRRSAAYHGPIAWAHQTEQAHGPSRQRGITTPTSEMVIASWPPMGLPEAMAGVLAR